MMKPHSRISTATGVTICSSGVITVGIYLHWGTSLGMPDHQRSVAGVFYAALAAILLGFVLLFLRGYIMQQADKAREWLWFAIALSVAPGILYGQLFMVDLIGMVPANWSHHGYQIAAAIGLSTPILVGHFLAMYSRLTQSRAVN